MAYAKQMGYDYIVVRQRQYTNVGKYAAIKGQLSGLKFYLSNPHYYYESGSHGDHYHLREINASTSYTQEQKDWYTKNKVCKNSESFADNLAKGWFSSSTQFISVWDFQQQAVIDAVINGIISAIKKYQDAIPNFNFSGYVIDAPRLTGDFKIWENGSNKSVKLSDLTGGTSSCANVNHIHDYSSFEEGMAAFYKNLNSRLKTEFPNNSLKWIIEPYHLYSTGSIDSWIDKIKDRADKDELTPDMILQEAPSTGFVDNANNFNSGVNIAKNSVGISQRSKVDEYENRLYAAKAGINGAWYNWHGQWGNGVSGSSNMPNFQSIAEVYSRLKLIRCIPNWDNLNGVSLSERSWDGSVYQSKKDGKFQSYISGDLMYSRHPETGKLFVVFNTYSGTIKLNADEVVSSIQGIDGYFAESVDANTDIEISDNPASGSKELKLKSSVTIPTDATYSQIKGKGYIITTKTLPQATTNLAGSVKSGAVTLNATVNANNSPASAWFEYGTTSGSYTQQTSSQSISGSSDTSLSANLSGLSEGKSYYYRIAAKNDAGTAYGNEISFSVLDESAPSMCSLSINNAAEAVNSIKVTLKLSAQDNLGVSGYYLSSRSSAPAPSGSGWVTTRPVANYSSSISYALASGDSTKTLYCWFKDASGNVSRTVKDSIILDTVNPIIAITYPVSSAGVYSTKENIVTLSGTASDAVSGIKTVNWSSGPGAQTAAAEGTTNWSIANINLKQGDATITVSAQDKAGNAASASLRIAYGLEPGLSVLEAANISATSATLSGSVNPNGLSTSAWFEYGTTLGEYANQTPAQTVSGSSNTSVSANISALSEGKVYYYRMAAKNSSGTAYSNKMSFITLDTSIPSGSISISGALSAVNTPEVTIRLSAKDNIGVEGYYLSSSYISPKASDSGWVSLTPVLTYSASIEYTFSGEDGRKILYCWYKDGAGNISKVSTCSIMLDTASPSLSVTDPDIEVGSAYYTAMSDISFKGTSRDEVSGVESIFYSVNNGSARTAQGTANWSASGLTLKMGENTITITAKDQADNSASLSITVIYGLVPDLTTLKAGNITSGSAALSGTVNPNNLATSVWFEYGMTSGSYAQQTPAKAVSGSSDISVSANISALSEGKSYYYRIAAKNNLGIVYGAELSFAALDESAPIGSISINSGLAAVNTTTVNLNISANDNIGIAGYYLSAAKSAPLSGAANWVNLTDSATVYSAVVSYTLSSGDGDKTVYCWFKDSGGNISEAVSDTVTLDTAKPVISITTPVSSQSYATSSNTISLGGTSSDTISGIKGIAYTIKQDTAKSAIPSTGAVTTNVTLPAVLITIGTNDWSISGLSLSEGENVISVTAQDKAGNSLTDTITVTYTAASAPKVTTGSASNISSSSVVLSSTVNPNNLDATAWFDYGKVSGSYTQKSSDKSILTGSVDASVSLDIDSLTEGTTYYYRASAQNTKGTAYGVEKTFKTIETIDTSAPVGDISINSNAKHTKSRTASLSLSATDNKGVTGYYISANNIAPLASASGWVAVNSTTNYSAKINYVLSSGDGLKTVYCWYKDAAGNVSTTP